MQNLWALHLLNDKLVPIYSTTVPFETSINKTATAASVMVKLNIPYNINRLCELKIFLWLDYLASIRGKILMVTSKILLYLQPCWLAEKQTWQYYVDDCIVRVYYTPLHHIHALLWKWNLSYYSSITFYSPDSIGLSFHIFPPLVASTL